VPIGETLAAYLLQDGTLASATRAAELFREVLFVHPLAIHPVLGLQAALQQMDSLTGSTDAAAIQDLVDFVVQGNDTVADPLSML